MEYLKSRFIFLARLICNFLLVANAVILFDFKVGLVCWSSYFAILFIYLFNSRLMLKLVEHPTSPMFVPFLLQTRQKI